MDEPPLIVLPRMAAEIGLQNAIVLQQLHFLLNLKGGGKMINERKWVYNTYKDWKEIFPFWSEKTIQNILIEMEKMFLIETCQPEGRVSRRKYYTINRGMVAALEAKVRSETSPEQAIIAPSEQANIAPSLYRTETTQRLRQRLLQRLQQRKRTDVRLRTHIGRIPFLS
jgi:DNA-binding PadR family transcriptional regulator